jgi:hypothetical protein
MNRDAALIEKTLNGQSEAYAELVKKYQLPNSGILYITRRTPLNTRERPITSRTSPPAAVSGRNGISRKLRNKIPHASAILARISGRQKASCHR